MNNANKEYNLAVALLQFKAAFKKLADASKEMDDDEIDLTEAYPFYLLDYEKIEPAVGQWCSLHAARLMRLLPERVDNPICLNCSYYRKGLLPSGLCKGFEATGCNAHPTIIYDKNAVIPYLLSQGVKLDTLSDTAIHLLYMRKADEAYEAKTY